MFFSDAGGGGISGGHPRAGRGIQDHRLFLRRGSTPIPTDREFVFDNLLVRIHLIIELIIVEWPCAMGV